MEGCIELKRIELAASAEMEFRAVHWLFLGIRVGAAYASNSAGHRALNGGDLIVVPPENSIRLRSSQLGICSLAVCEVNADSLQGVLTVRERERLRGAGSTERAVSFFSTESDLASRFVPLASRLGELRLIDRISWIALAADYWASVLPADAVTPDASDASDRFQALVARLSAVEFSKLSATELAQACGCSVRHFSRLFHERFGKSLRDFQIEERLRYASQLLRDSHNKVIDVALESGFSHLSHFNSLFKSQFGLTPSAWRRRRDQPRNSRNRRMGVVATAVLALLAIPSAKVEAGAPATNAPALNAPAHGSTNAPAGGGTNAPAKASPHFAITSYLVEGNTVLSKDVVNKVLGDHVGPDCTFDTLRAAIKELQLTYRGRGFVTVNVTLPVQSLTNGVVHLKVTEGMLTSIRVTGNRWFSSNNVMSSLPSLRTNLILNSGWFEAELDQANANRDRQIYPIIGAGPDPGTTELQLKVKDRFPLHGRWELNNKGSPDTPDLRMDASVQYGNLWQMEHQVGLQYNFTPGEMKPSRVPVYDEPLISSYSGFYRMPLVPRSALLSDEAFTSTDFGYDPIARKFKAPPSSGQPELLIFASKSVSDSGVGQAPLQKILGDLSNTNDHLFISEQSTHRSITINEGLGFRVQAPLPKLGMFQQSFSIGPDWKHFYQSAAATNQYNIQLDLSKNVVFPRTGLIDINPPVVQPLDLPESANDYVLMSANYTLSEADKWGGSSLTLTPSMSVRDVRGTQTLFHHSKDTSVITQKPLGHFFTLNAGYSRDQKLVDEWLLSLRANGQWANRSLLSPEQFGLGGTMGVRGYRDGEEYGDAGWRVLVEPKTPSIELGNWQGESIIRGRFSLFTDYGERYLQNPQGRPPSLAEWGAGVGAVVTVSDHFEARAAMAWPLLDTPGVKAWTGRIHFSIGANF